MKIIGDVLTLEDTRPFKGNMLSTYLFQILLVNFIHKKKSPIVEQVFLIHEDGRLISYATLKREDYQDEELVSSMLTAVKDLLTVVFLKKETQRDVGLYRFQLGERNVILRMGKHFYIAIVINGEEDKALLDKSKDIVLDIQEKYGDIFYYWFGNMRDVDGTNEIIIKLLPLEELSEAERETIKDKGLLKKMFELWSRMYKD